MEFLSSLFIVVKFDITVELKDSDDSKQQGKIRYLHIVIFLSSAERNNVNCITLYKPHCKMYHEHSGKWWDRH